ncbi:UNVERIFIED_CONTAM: hypothetical protein H355_011707 [Colinus virginianus]|nr:hypothetical protein H355_011707 [Colinus virginianus]
MVSIFAVGTHIIYDRKFLLECKNSPGVRTLPCCLPQIPGVISLAQSSLVKLEELKESHPNLYLYPSIPLQIKDQFEMDI